MKFTKFYTSYGKDYKKYGVEIYSQPLKDYLFARAYHFYDMHFPLRGHSVTRFQKILYKLGAEDRTLFKPAGQEPKKPRWRDKLYMWDVEQDFRCYYLSYQKNVINIYRAEMTEQQAILAGIKIEDR